MATFVFVPRSVKAAFLYTDEIAVSNIVRKQLVTNGAVKWFDIREARIFLNVAPVGAWRKETMAITDGGLCAMKRSWSWESHEEGAWKRVYDKRHAVIWLIRHGHIVPDVLKDAEAEMRA
jgi:hypothetical protein